MPPIARVENLSKLYRIGEQEAAYGTLREAIVRGLRTPLRKMQRKKASDAPTVWALRDVNFEVQPGEVVGIIGRNGAGKSTLLKILSRITEPTSGRVELYGRVGSLLEVGTGFHSELTGRENVYLNAAILGMSRAEIGRKFDEIVDFAEIEEFLDTPVKRYSSGMFVRLAFAVAAHLEPEILLVDEVLAVGDARFQKKCLDKMEDVGHEGRTVLFVSHNMSAVTRLCPRSILLDKGSVKLDGNSSEVASAYFSPDSSAMAQREWSDLESAPGNDIARLSAVRIRNRSGAVAEIIDIREPIQIEIEYFNFPNNLRPYAGVQLYDQNGICLFCTGDFVNKEWRHTDRAFSGRVISTCTIPGNFLSEGRVSVLAAITTHNPSRFLAYERDAVSFLVTDQSQGDGARGEYVGDFPGVVRPLFDWKVRTNQTSS
jgi:lipopolysaccharide transport system ATP-binding protein